MSDNNILETSTEYRTRILLEGDEKMQRIFKLHIEAAEKTLAMRLGTSTASLRKRFELFMAAK